MFHVIVLVVVSKNSRVRARVKSSEDDCDDVGLFVVAVVVEIVEEGITVEVELLDVDVDEELDEVLSIVVVVAAEDVVSGVEVDVEEELEIKITYCFLSAENNFLTELTPAAVLA